MRRRIIVVGWYGHGNLGDEGFKAAFRHLWGDRADFVFIDEVPIDVNQYDALIFGGGSFLDRHIPAHVRPSEVTIPIGFVGVGIQGSIAPSALEWLDAASIVVARNQPAHPLTGLWREKLIVAPDLLFARPWPEPSDRRGGGTLVLGNTFAIPTRFTPHWFASAWSWFASELGQALDGKKVSFYPMCQSPGMEHDDALFGPHIVAQMSNRRGVTIYSGEPDEAELVELISKAGCVITMRFHGAVLAALAQRPFVGICMHDKARDFFTENGLSNWLDYFGITHQALAEVQQPPVGRLAALRREAHETWQHLSDTVAERLRM